MATRKTFRLIGIACSIGAFIIPSAINAAPPIDNPGTPHQQTSDSLNMLKEEVTVIKEDVAIIKGAINSLSNTTVHKGTSWLNFDLSVDDGQHGIFQVASCGSDGMCTGHINGLILTDDPGTTFRLICNLLDGQGTSSAITLATFTGATTHNFREDFACPWSLRIDVDDGPLPGSATSNAYLGAGYVSTKNVTYNAEP